MPDTDALARRPLAEVNPHPAHPWYRALARLGQALFTRTVTQEWSGLERLPRTGPVLLAASHLSNAEPPLLAVALVWGGRWPRFLAKAELFHVPLLGGLARALGQIPVYRDSDRAHEALSAAEDALRDGECVVIYPEGTITRDPDLWPMTGRPGVARLALAAGCPVIPVGQWGAQDLMPGHSVGIPRLFPRKRHAIALGEPVDLTGLSAGVPADVEEATRRIRDALPALVSGLRGEPAPVGRWDPRVGRRTTGRG